MFLTLCLISYQLFTRQVTTHAVQRYFNVSSGYRYTVGEFLETVTVPTVTHCSKKCLEHVNCNVFNIGPTAAGDVSGLTCEVIRSNTQDVAIQSGWSVYSGKNDEKNIIVWFAKGGIIYILTFTKVLIDNVFCRTDRYFWLRWHGKYGQWGLHVAMRRRVTSA